MISSNSKGYKFLRYSVIGFFLVLVFCFGVIVGYLKLQPVPILLASGSYVKSIVAPNISESLSESDLFEQVFTDPVIAGTLIHPPISDLRELRSANISILMSVEGFETAYDSIIISQYEQIWLDNSIPITKLQFNYQQSAFEAYAYGKLPQECNNEKTGSLIIPGSGHNQSSAILNRDRSNYHFGILDVLSEEKFDNFIFIKPNEDILAWHNGTGKKVGGIYKWNYHLNRNGSYSTSYLVHSLAITKYLQYCYDTFLLAGLSQGGAAVLVNSIQSEPDFAIVSSGHSLLLDKIEGSGHNQLIGVPGYGNLSIPEHLIDLISKSKTRFLFSYGKKETDIYQFEAYTGYSENYLQLNKNVDFIIHDGGHEFPVNELSLYLNNNLSLQ